jgi:hypothetical protein
VGNEVMGMAKTLMVASALAATMALAGCDSDANVASQNLSRAADQFEINRRVVFYNGITGEYILSVEGLCSLGNFDGARQLSVTCKTGPGSYKKHFLGLSDNVTYFAEQIEGANVSAYHYRVIFKPQSILPDIDFKGDAGELLSGGE